MNYHNPYALPGLEVATLRGRKQVFRKVCADLGEKTTPDHISIVAPRYFGKTVLLHALASHFANPDSPYQLVVFWDLKHDTPETDSAFMHALARKLDERLLAGGDAEFHEYLLDSGEGIEGRISDVVDSLGAEGHRMLVLLDDFDRLAGQHQISKNLWDYLRSLAQKDCLRFVTSSRRRLRDCIPSRESRTSDFWNNFNNVVTLKPIERQAFEDFVEPLLAAGWTFAESAEKEFFNWTGGVPALAARICRELNDAESPGQAEKPTIDDLCKRMESTDWFQDTLATLWDDCPKDLQGVLLDLAEKPGIAANIAPLRQQILIERGYLVKEGNNVKASCRFMLTFAALHEVRQRDLRDLFKDPDTELRSLRSLLELRLAEVKGGDAETRSFIEHAIEGLAKGQRTALSGIRNIADEATRCAWNTEFPDGIIPVNVQQQLTLSWETGGCGLKPEDLPAAQARNAEVDTRMLRIRRKILRLGAGDQQRTKVTKRVTRPMMMLIEHLHALGNYGQHMNDIPEELERRVDISFCAAACWAAVELLKRMAEDFELTGMDFHSPGNAGADPEGVRVRMWS